MRRRKRKRTERERHISLMAKKARHEAAKRRKTPGTPGRGDREMALARKAEQSRGIFSPLIPRRGGVR